MTNPLLSFEREDYFVTQGVKTSAIAGLGAAFDIAKPESGFNPEYRLQSEIYRDVRGALDISQPGPGPATVKFGDHIFSPDISGRLTSQNFQPDDDTLGRMIEELKANDIEAPEAFTPEALEARRSGVLAELKADRAEARDILERSPAPGTLGFLGAVGAEFTDPINLATIPIGAPIRAGLLATVAIEAVINAAIEGLQTPGRNAFLRMIDEEEQGILANMAVGAVFGAAIGGGVKGVQVAAPKIGKLSSAALARSGRLFDRALKRRVAEAAAGSTDAEARGIGQAVTDDLDDLDAASTTEAPEAEREHEARAQEAVAAAIEGREPNMSDRPISAVPRGSIINGEIEEVLPGELEVMPELFQFKSEADAAGVTDKLRDVPEWRSERAGTILVYEFDNGLRAVADGHQRTALAKRIMAADPSQEIKMAARVFREADGFTPERVRGIAALKNIAEAADGMTAALARDAAKVLRMDPGAIAELPAGPGIARAQALSNLSEDAFQLLINDVIPDRFAEIIGREVENRDLHMAMVRLLERAEPSTVTQAEAIIRQAKAAPIEKTVTEDLFGTQEIAESLYLERAKVLESSMRMIREDKRTFATLTKRGDKIEGTGKNKLDQATNKEVSARLDEILTAIDRLAYRAGPISEALNDGAKTYKETGKLKDAATEVFDAIRDHVERNGLGDSARAGAGKRAAQPESKGAKTPDTFQGFDDPVEGPGAKEQIEATRIERTAEPEPEPKAAALDTSEGAAWRDLEIETETETGATVSLKAGAVYDAIELRRDKARKILECLNG